MNIKLRLTIKRMEEAIKLQEWRIKDLLVRKTYVWFISEFADLLFKLLLSEVASNILYVQEMQPNQHVKSQGRPLIVLIWSRRIGS